MVLYISSSILTGVSVVVDSEQSLAEDDSLWCTGWYII